MSVRLGFDEDRPHSDVTPASAHRGWPLYRVLRLTGAEEANEPGRETHQERHRADTRAREPSSASMGKARFCHRCRRLATELFSPGGHVVKKDMQSAILDYFKNFTDLKITVNEMFLSEDGTRLAIQWDWTVTRKRDRKRATTHDAILVHLVGGKIGTWNEYFDFGNSMECRQPRSR
jgi:hypothetical protein